MECQQVKMAGDYVGPSHLFKAYWDALTGKRDLNN